MEMMIWEWETWSRAVKEGDAETLNQLVHDGVATTALHYDAWLQSPPTTPWSDRVLAIYACGPGIQPVMGTSCDTNTADSVYTLSNGTLATRGAYWFHQRMQSDPDLLVRMTLYNPLYTVRPAVHGAFNEVDADYTPWLVHLVGDAPWNAETPVHLLLVQLWQADGAWTENTWSQIDAFPSPPLLVLYFLFYFRSVLTHAENSVRTWLKNKNAPMDVEPEFIRDLLAWEPSLQSIVLHPYQCAYFHVLAGRPAPDGDWSLEQLVELMYLGDAKAALELSLATYDAAGDVAAWLAECLQDEQMDDAKKTCLVMYAPTAVLETLLERRQALSWVAMAYQGRGTPVDDRVLVLLDAFNEPNSQDWYNDVAARWRGSAEGLRTFLAHARRKERLPAVWWTAVAYSDATWQEECRNMTPIVTTCDELLMYLGPSVVRASLHSWKTSIHSTSLRASVAAWIRD